MAQGFRLAGYEVTERPEDARIRVVNTCTVTGEAGRKSRRAARTGQAAQKVVVTGCHSEVHPEEFPDADLIVPSAEKEALAALTLEKFGMEGPALGMDYRRNADVPVYPLVLNHTRAFVKIQDGCDLRCSFCLTTVARGASRCRPLQEIIGEVQSLVEKGCQEVVLTGVHAGSFQHGSSDLADCMEAILEQTDLPRLRLSSLEPWNFRESWVRLWERFPGRMCRHLHMSLQSGSDSVLQRMRRYYTAEVYQQKIDCLRRQIPDLAVTTDLIVGFPGETEAEHRESLAFVRSMDFADAHVFTFSPRPGTEASRMPDSVPTPQKRERRLAMQEATHASRTAFIDRLLGRPVQVLWETSRGRERGLTGLTDHYVTVETDDHERRENTIEELIPAGRKGHHLVTA